MLNLSEEIEHFQSALTTAKNETAAGKCVGLLALPHQPVASSSNYNLSLGTFDTLNIGGQNREKYDLIKDYLKSGQPAQQSN